MNCPFCRKRFPNEQIEMTYRNRNGDLVKVSMPICTVCHGEFLRREAEE